MPVNTFALTSNFNGNQVAASGALIERFREWIRGLNVPLPPKADLLKQIAEAYDDYVAPIDIPGVPNLVEPWLDSALKAIVLQQVSRIYDNFAATN